MLQQDGDGVDGDDGDGVVDDGDDDPDEVQRDDDDDGDDFPSPGGNFLRQDLPARELFLSRWFPSRRGGGVFRGRSSSTRFPVEEIYAKGGLLGWTQGATP